MVIQGNGLTLQLLLFGIPVVSTRQWARFPFCLGNLLRRPVRTNVMSRVEQEVSEGVGLVDGGQGCGLSLQRQQLSWRSDLCGFPTRVKLTSEFLLDNP